MSSAGLLLVLTLPAVILAPHLLPLHRMRPTTGALVWLLALALRAVVAMSAVLLALEKLAHARLIEATLGWCWHEMLPVVPEHLGFGEHPVAHAVVAVPALGVAASVLLLLAGLVRSWLALRRWMSQAIGRGPLGSTIVPDERILVALTRLGRARVLVSNRALEELDHDELAAGLAHEVAHLRRAHRPVLMAGALFAALARPLPGTRAAELRLRLHLERDADRYVLRQGADRLSLAGAICKAAAGSIPPATVGLSDGGSVTLRVRELLDEGPGGDPLVERTARALVLLLLAVTLALAASGPAWAFSRNDTSYVSGHGCSHRGA